LSRYGELSLKQIHLAKAEEEGLPLLIFSPVNRLQNPCLLEKGRMGFVLEAALDNVLWGAEILRWNRIRFAGAEHFTFSL